MSGPTDGPQQLVPEAFLSHSSAQRELVLYLGARFSAHGLRYFSSFEVDQVFELGRPFDESLLQHVRDARVVVLVLSQQYLGSMWCLKELAEALAVQQQRPEKVLVPVLYGWQNPEQLQSWLQMPEQQHLHDSCLRWTGQPLGQLCSSVSSMHGLVFPPSSSIPQLADEVLEIVQRHIQGSGLSEQQFVGSTQWVDWAIDHLLQQNGKLGIWGMGGSGKTTLTMLLFDRLREQFDGRVARVEVGQQPSPHHLMNLQRHILESVCQVADAELGHPYAGAEALKRSLLAVPRFLVIVDDVWEDPLGPNMVDTLLPPEVVQACSSYGSWVVVATRQSTIVTTLLGSGTARAMPDGAAAQPGGPLAQPNVTSMNQGQLEHYILELYIDSVDDLQSSNQVVQEQAARALAHLAERNLPYDVLQLIAGESRVFRRLVQLLHSSDVKLSAAAAEALASLSAVSKKVQQQIAAAFFPRLIQLLQSKLPHHVAGAALTLANLASDGKWIQQQIAAVPGAIPALKQLLDNMHQDVPLLLSDWYNRQAVMALVNRIAGTAMPGDSDAPEPKQLALDGGTDDRPCCKDSLGVGTIAKGTGLFMLHPSTGPVTLAVYARWGAGKSSFMQLVETEMLLAAASEQLDVWEPVEGELHMRYNAILAKHEPGFEGAKQQLSDADLQALQALASPRLLTVWFNSWQYLNEEQVWSGLVFEVTQRLEEKLGLKHRCLMGQWWVGRPWRFLRLVCTDMRFCAATAYNWRTRRCDMVLRCFLPLLLVLALVGVSMGVGIWELQQQEAAARNATISIRPTNTTNGTAVANTPPYKGFMALTAIAGFFVSLLAAVVAVVTNCKQISDTLVDARSYFKFNDHGAKIGYQHAVIKDLRLLGELLGDSLSSLRVPPPAHQPRTKAAVAALMSAWDNVQRAAAFMFLCCCGCCISCSNREKLRRRLLNKPAAPARQLQQPGQPGQLQQPGQPGQPQQQQGSVGDKPESKPPQLQQLQQQQGSFEDKPESKPRIVVFIDDLDRCKPDKIVEVLEAINLVLAGSGFAVVVGMDKEFITSAIQHAYKDVEVMQQEAKAAEFLEKIVQVEVTLPSPKFSELSGYLEAQGARLAFAGVHVAVGDLAEPSAVTSSDTNSTPAASAPAPALEPTLPPGPVTTGTAAAGGGAEADAEAEAEAEIGAATQAGTEEGTGAGTEAEAAASAEAEAAAVEAAAAKAEAKAAKAEAKAAKKAQAAAEAAAAAAKPAVEQSSAEKAEAEKAETAAMQATAATIAAVAAMKAAKAAAQACGNSGSVHAVGAERASTRADRQRAEAVKASEDAAAAAHKAHHATSLGAASAARLEAERHCNTAKDAATAAKQAQAIAERNAQKAEAAKQGFSDVESKALELAHHAGLLLESTPRDLKRVMNRYLLAKYICKAREQDELQVAGKPVYEFGSEQERELLAWVLLWWKCPAAMRILRKVQVGEADANLATLLQQHHQAQARAASASTSNEDKQEGAVAGGMGAAGAAKPPADAAAAVAAAETGLAAATAAVSAAVKADAKKQAKAALKVASTQLELAKLWQLCTGGSQQQQQKIPPQLVHWWQLQQQQQQQQQQQSQVPSPAQPSTLEPSQQQQQLPPPQPPPPPPQQQQQQQPPPPPPQQQQQPLPQLPPPPPPPPQQQQQHIEPKQLSYSLLHIVRQQLAKSWLLYTGVGQQQQQMIQPQLQQQQVQPAPLGHPEIQPEQPGIEPEQQQVQQAQPLALLFNLSSGAMESYRWFGMD